MRVHPVYTGAVWQQVVGAERVPHGLPKGSQAGNTKPGEETVDGGFAAMLANEIQKLK